MGGGTAIKGKDFELENGTLEFTSGKEEASFEIKVLPDARLDQDITFSIGLIEPTVFGA